MRFQLEQKGALKMEEVVADQELSAEDKLVLVYLSYIIKTKKETEMTIEDVAKSYGGNLTQSLLNLQLKGLIKIENQKVILILNEEEYIEEEKKRSDFLKQIESAQKALRKPERTEPPIQYKVDNQGQVELVTKPKEDNRVYKSELDREIVRLLEMGTLNQKEIAEYLGTSPFKVSQAKSKYKIEKPYMLNPEIKKAKEEKMKTIKQLLQNGWSQKAIAEHLNITQSSVSIYKKSIEQTV